MMHDYIPENPPSLAVGDKRGGAIMRDPLVPEPGMVSTFGGSLWLGLPWNRWRL